MCFYKTARCHLVEAYPVSTLSILTTETMSRKMEPENRRQGSRGRDPRSLRQLFCLPLSTDCRPRSALGPRPCPPLFLAHSGRSLWGDRRTDPCPVPLERLTWSMALSTPWSPAALGHLKGYIRDRQVPPPALPQASAAGAAGAQQRPLVGSLRREGPLAHGQEEVYTA